MRVLECRLRSIHLQLLLHIGGSRQHTDGTACRVCVSIRPAPYEDLSSINDAAIQRNFKKRMC
eukprot:COSAG02_NODE_575_length_20117_cov_5.801139_10_plen_63_part_00